MFNPLTRKDGCDDMSLVGERMAMAFPCDLRAWAAALRKWAATVRDAKTMAVMSRLADDLEKLADGNAGGTSPTAERQ